MRIDHTFIAHLCCNGLLLSFLLFLVTLSMLMDRAGCYNVREKKHCTPAYFYRQFLRNCHLLRARRRSALLAIVIYECDFPEFQIRGMVLQHLRLYKLFTFSATGISVACYVHNDVSKFPVTITVLQHLRLHKWFTFSALGESTGVAGDRGKLE